MTTPDAPLAVAWAASLYFLHRALIGDERRAWYGVARASGSAAFQVPDRDAGPGGVGVCILDRRARTWLLPPAPYVAVLIALALFAPVVYWNYVNEWASFSPGRGTLRRHGISLPHLLKNAVFVATPLPIAVLPLLFVRQWTARPGLFPGARPHARPQPPLRELLHLRPARGVRMDLAPHCRGLTGPARSGSRPCRCSAGRSCARTRLPGSDGAACYAERGRDHRGAPRLLRSAQLPSGPGTPGRPYPEAFARAIGWSEAAHSSRGSTIGSARVRRSPVIVGMDKYFIASQLSFFGTRSASPRTRRRREDAKAARLAVTTIASLSGGTLMFAYWDPPATLRGRTLILVARAARASRPSGSRPTSASSRPRSTRCRCRPPATAVTAGGSPSISIGSATTIVRRRGPTR